MSSTIMSPNDIAPATFELPDQFYTFGGRISLILKRALDIVGSSVALVLLFPLFVIVAALVWFESGSPIFYRWNVVGRHGRHFTGYKFRTMVQNADALTASLSAANEMSGPAFKMRDDPRVTKIGRFLRKTSIDELPQLWSVLKGDMSLVGPRPPLVREWQAFEPWQRRKLAVVPGITCTWQAFGRASITDFDTWMRMDIEYIENWSLTNDFKILWATVFAVLTSRGAF